MSEGGTRGAMWLHGCNVAAWGAEVGVVSVWRVGPRGSRTRSAPVSLLHSEGKPPARLGPRPPEKVVHRLGAGGMGGP